MDREAKMHRHAECVQEPNPFGWPSYIRTDSGPQFRGEFVEYCAGNIIKHELASAYNPESNGLAEAAVKNMKFLILR